MGKTNKWKVQIKAEVWYETEVEADSIEEAIGKADPILLSGKGTKVEGTFEYTDYYCTSKADDESL
jgi:hypothetical protein